MSSKKKPMVVPHRYKAWEDMSDAERIAMVEAVELGWRRSGATARGSLTRPSSGSSAPSKAPAQTGPVRGSAAWWRLPPRKRNPYGVDWTTIGLGLGAIGIGLLFWWQRDTVVDVIAGKVAIMDPVLRGRRLSFGVVADDGIVPVAPATLALAAELVVGHQVGLDVYGLARMIRSEGAAAGRIRAHVALNDAEELGWSVHTLMTYATNSKARGVYGEQFTPASRGPGGVKNVRRYSTARDPYEGDVRIAEAVIAEHAAGIDPSGGAVKFVDKSSMGVQTGSGSYADLVERWGKEGLRPFSLPEYSDDLIVFRRLG